MSLTIGIVLFDGAEELDWAGPWEVLTCARREGDVVLTVAERAEPIRCAKGLRVLADRTFDDCPPLDVIVVPGGKGTRTEMSNPSMLDFLRAQSASAQWTTSVCTGAFVLHGAGLLEGRRATTHWATFDELRQHAPDLELDPDARWVVDGNIVTAAGVSAGIDMALWLVGQVYDVDHARAVQKYIQYDPAPPYQDVATA
ncbi:MAG TPA: DJ-1/PfpI family protein [Acidimicrobiales bacterium]|nr:DJ-1/PfpI family protein [Acidimicrobiales bacterium]